LTLGRIGIVLKTRRGEANTVGVQHLPRPRGIADLRQAVDHAQLLGKVGPRRLPTARPEKPTVASVVRLAARKRGNPASERRAPASAANTTPPASLASVPFFKLLCTNAIISGCALGFSGVAHHRRQPQLLPNGD